MWIPTRGAGAGPARRATRRPGSSGRTAWLQAPAPVLKVGAHVVHGHAVDSWIDPGRMVHSSSRFRTLSISRVKESTEKTFTRGIARRTVAVFVVEVMPFSDIQ